MGPEAQPFGLCRPSFVRPHSVRAWSCHHTNKMHHLWWRRGVFGEEGGRGRRSLRSFCAPPGPDPSGRRLWLPSILYIRLSLGYRERAVVHGNSWSDHISSMGNLTFSSNSTFPSSSWEKKIYSRVWWKLAGLLRLNSRSSTTFNSASDLFLICLRLDFAVQEIINGPKHWSFLLQWQ